MNSRWPSTMRSDSDELQMAVYNAVRSGIVDERKRNSLFDVVPGETVTTSPAGSPVLPSQLLLEVNLDAWLKEATGFSLKDLERSRTVRPIGKADQLKLF